MHEYWSGLPWGSSPGDLPDPGIEPGSPALQADSLLVELSVQVIETSPEEISGRNLNANSQM